MVSRFPRAAPSPRTTQRTLAARRTRAPGLRSLAWLALTALAGLVPPAFGQAVPLGTASSFGVLGASALTNSGPSVITGDIGLSPNGAGSVTGFSFSAVPGPGTLIGTTHFADATALAAQVDLTTAFNTLTSRTCTTPIVADLGGTTLAPGVYCSAASMGLTGTVTLDAQGDPDAVFIFQMGSTLTTAAGSVVRLINGARSCNVFWQAGSSATLGTGTAFAGNLLAQASITLTTGVNAEGRFLARTGAVTMDTNALSVCSLAVLAAPALGKSFAPATINAGGVSTLTVTLSNANAAVATLTAPLIDTLPSGVVIAPVPNAGSTCGGAGAPIAVAGGATVTLPAGRSIPANGSCTLTVDVTAALGGSYINTLAAGALVTGNGNNTAPAVATLTVVSPLVPPLLGKSFAPSTINAGGVSTLTVTLSNANATVATLTAPLIDTLPVGVVIAPVPNAGSTCGGAGAPIALAGGSTVTLPAGRSIPANGSCTLTVDVTAALGGSYINTLAAGALVTGNGNNPAPAVATLTVVTPLVSPLLGKSFAPSTINAGGVSTLTVTLSNANAAVATLTAPLIDTLPVGVVIAPVPNAGSTCGGAGAPLAVAGGATVTLPTGRSIPANGSCTLTVDVTAALGGSYINTLAAGALVTGNGNNPAPAVATLTVVTPLVSPLLGKSFAPSTINAGGVSTLTVTLSNANAAAATLTAPLIDTLPVGVVIAPVPNAGSTCGGAGALVASAGGSTVTLPAGRSIPANGSCTLAVDVTAAAAGTYVNTLAAGALATTNGNNPAAASATLNVIPPIVPPPPPPLAAEPIPTLSEWATLLLAALLAIAGQVALRESRAGAPGHRR